MLLYESYFDVFLKYLKYKSRKKASALWNEDVLSDINIYFELLST